MALWVRTDTSSWVDCHSASAARVEPMKVLLLGVSRTVTGSMRAASKILGRVEPMATATSQLDIDAWTDALNARFFGKGPKLDTQEWEKLLGHCEMPDNGVPSLAQELGAATTGAPPSSPTRHGKAPRADAAVAKLGRNKPFVVAACLDARFLRRLRPFFPLVWLTFFSDFPSPSVDIAIASAPHLADLGDARLLEHKVGDGWERLCILLQRDPPDADCDDVEYPASTISLSASDACTFGEKMNRLTHGVFQGLGGTVVMQIARVGSVGISIFFAHRNP
ncbi:hypothetical protein GGX14DRAFT_540339 [Mycena pura]|uniref:Uncharacterized protein n=1 Tax=Mycena pura TaxID=153505 RepID=A0AAD6YKR1_9AGAR|nr:hypothetical protein GGX14DRAFT_540339 [Mycena pura]